MKRAFFFVALIAFVTSCSTEASGENKTLEHELSTDDESNIEENSNQLKTYLFKSEDEGVKEFMRCMVNEDGGHEWVYFTEKNEKEVKLGTRKEAGFEVVYFLAKPKEGYWVYGSECGFTLSDDTRKTSQWYAQMQPRCADDMF